jgi:transposase
VQTRTQAKNRVHKVLEDTNIKLSRVVTDLFGISGRHMLAALIAGERDANTLAALALRKLWRKLPQLELALVGQFTAHHARFIQGALYTWRMISHHFCRARLWSRRILGLPNG